MTVFGFALTVMVPSSNTYVFVSLYRVGGGGLSTGIIDSPVLTSNMVECASPPGPSFLWELHESGWNEARSVCMLLVTVLPVFVHQCVGPDVRAPFTNKASARPALFWEDTAADDTEGRKLGSVGLPFFLSLHQISMKIYSNSQPPPIIMKKTKNPQRLRQTVCFLLSCCFYVLVMNFPFGF